VVDDHACHTTTLAVVNGFDENVVQEDCGFVSLQLLKE